QRYRIWLASVFL
ncbi:macB-like periplasmic core domain protein, partial [Vibrio parahaemolyticus 861]